MATWTTTVKDWTAEAVTSAALDAQLRDFANAFGALGSYTPTLTGSTTNPTLGTGSTSSGRYGQVQKFVFGYFDITFGTSGTAAGSGNYQIAAPVTISSNYNGQPVGRAVIFDSSGSAVGYVDLIPSSANFLLRYSSAYPTGTLTTVTHAVPWAWSASDYIRGSFMYEAA